jgi:hypothetical protein
LAKIKIILRSLKKSGRRYATIVVKLLNGRETTENNATINKKHADATEGIWWKRFDRGGARGERNWIDFGAIEFVGG